MKKFKKTGRAFFVGGINGSGKSTVLKEISAKDERFEVIHGSKYLMEYLGIEKGDYETLRSTPDDTKEKAKENIAKEISSRKDPSKIVLFDAHYIKIHNGKISNAIEGNWIALFEKLFFIKSDAKTILSRIENDPRDRKLFSSQCSTEKEKLAFLSKCSDLSLSVMKEAGKKIGVPTFNIENEDGKIEKCVESFLNINKIIN